MLSPCVEKTFYYGWELHINDLPMPEALWIYNYVLFVTEFNVEMSHILLKCIKMMMALLIPLVSRSGMRLIVTCIPSVTINPLVLYVIALYITNISINFNTVHAISLLFHHSCMFTYVCHKYHV